MTSSYGRWAIFRRPVPNCRVGRGVSQAAMVRFIIAFGWGALVDHVATHRGGRDLRYGLLARNRRRRSIRFGNGFVNASKGGPSKERLARDLVGDPRREISLRRHSRMVGHGSRRGTILRFDRSGNPWTRGGSAQQLVEFSEVANARWRERRRLLPHDRRRKNNAFK